MNFKDLTNKDDQMNILEAAANITVFSYEIADFEISHNFSYGIPGKTDGVEFMSDNNRLYIFFDHQRDDWFYKIVQSGRTELIRQLASDLTIDGLFQLTNVLVGRYVTALRDSNETGRVERRQGEGMMAQTPTDEKTHENRVPYTPPYKEWPNR